MKALVRVSRFLCELCLHHHWDLGDVQGVNSAAEDSSLPLDEPRLSTAGWDSAQQNTTKILSEILLFPMQAWNESVWKNPWRSWVGQFFPGSMKSFSATLSAPSQAMHSADNDHRWIHKVIIGKGVGASMYRTNQMCPIDQASFSWIFLAAIPNSNNYFRK